MTLVMTDHKKNQFGENFFAIFVFTLLSNLASSYGDQNCNLKVSLQVK